MAKDAKTPLVITVSGDRAIHEVVDDHPKSVERLRKIKGVADVSPDHSIDIGPPGASS